jgi:hypothetical protein
VVSEITTAVKTGRGETKNDEQEFEKTHTEISKQTADCKSYQ